jgi:hypothetical protein
MKMIRYIALFLFASASVLYGIWPTGPIVPPKVEDILGFCNGPASGGDVSRENFIAFLQHARCYTTLPADLEKRGEAGELEFQAEGEVAKNQKEKMTILYDLHGVFSDKRGGIYFWAAVGPRFLTVVTAGGRGCFYYLDEKEPVALEIHPIARPLPNKSTEATPMARMPAADAPVAPAVGRASS